jgi:hypothetical protein
MRYTALNDLRPIMLIFLDTEYTDSLNCDLISIGMVSEDGEYELYLERNDYMREWCSPFVHAAVLPLLGPTTEAVDRDTLEKRLSTWFSLLPRTVTIACDSFTDWELLFDALDGKRPQNLTGRYDLRGQTGSPEFHHAVVRYHECSGPWHHALHDARAHRCGWLACKNREKNC